MENTQILIISSQFAILTLLLPVGLILISGAGLAGRRPAKSAMAGLGALALAAFGFWACGFAFQMGGVGLVSDLRGLEGLVWEWASPLNLDWGVMGLRGFLLLDEASTPAALTLFLAYLPAVAVAVLLPMLALRERMPGWMAALSGLLVAALAYPVAGNWFSGGGWLMHIGQTLGYGHGYQYAHDRADALVDQEHLPPALKGQTYYEPSTRGYEAIVRDRLLKWRKILKQRADDHEQKKS